VLFVPKVSSPDDRTKRSEWANSIRNPPDRSHRNQKQREEEEPGDQPSQPAQ
jgi:hypothetical protein